VKKTTHFITAPLLLILAISVSGCNKNYFFHKAPPQQLPEKVIEHGSLQARKSVYLPTFNNVVNTTSAKIELFTNTAKPLVIMSGPQSGIDSIKFTVNDNTLLIEDTAQEDSQKNEKNKKFISPSINVKMRLHVPHLQDITNAGPGAIYGRPISSHNSTFTAKAGGSLVLAGDVEIKELNTSGSGAVFIKGIHGKSLDVSDESDTKVTLSGDMNIHHLHAHSSGPLTISGKVNISSIDKADAGKLTINGIHSDNLTVKKTGIGDVFLAGTMNLYQLHAKGNSEIVISGIHSDLLDIHASGKGTIRLLGDASQLFAELWGSLKFQGEKLQAKTAFVQVNNTVESHINVTDSMSIHANGESQVYYSGNPEISAKFIDPLSRVIRNQVG